MLRLWGNGLDKVESKTLKVAAKRSILKNLTDTSLSIADQYGTAKQTVFQYPLGKPYPIMARKKTQTSRSRSKVVEPEVVVQDDAVDTSEDLDNEAKDPEILLDTEAEELAGATDAADVDVAEDVEPEKEFELLPAKGRKDAVPYDPLRLYLKEISRFPLLEPEEEVELARRVRATGDEEAAFRIVSSHLRLVVKIAMDFQRRWMQNVLDLVQEGNVGLMRAVQKFDPEKGIKFSYYAAFWIKAYILKFIMDNWRMVKIGTTQAQRKLFYNLNKERQRLKSLGYDADTATLSQNLNVSQEQVREMEQRLEHNDLSLNLPLGEDSSATRMDVLPALEPGIEEVLAKDEIARHLHEHLESIIPDLNEKELDILKLRLLSDQPVTLREIGEKYSITRERVRQLEARLLSKLRVHLSKEIKDFSPEWISGEQ